MGKIFLLVLIAVNCLGAEIDITSLRNFQNQSAILNLGHSAVPVSQIG